jgi:hypothetical protein
MVAESRIVPLVAGRFVLRERLARGGAGELYDALDQATGERVSLRLLRGGTSGAERYAREIEQLAGLEHPGIVRHVAHGMTAAGQRYLATEWLEGEDLAERLRREPLGVAEGVAMGIALAKALAAAHERDMLHLDLNPGSVFLPGFRAARAKLLDFAPVRARDPVRDLTRGIASVATRGYVAPELALGDRRRVGPRADLFALGCVLYEALAGAPAFEAADAQDVVRRILFVDPAPVESRVPGVPAELASVVGALLSKEPDGRPASAEEVARELAAIPCVMSPLDIARAGDMNVLLEGPGWDAHGFAERLHEGSRRRRKPYVAVYGAALRVADLAHVSGGTLLLEEPEKLGAEAQRTLARFVEVRAVSSPHGPVHADVRIVTHAPLHLRLAVSARSFRPDLFRALAGIRLTVG